MIHIFVTGGTFGKEYDELTGTDNLDEVVLVDQAPIGRSARSNPVTYLKAFDPIRELFAATKDARSRGLSASHFSFNVPGGRCETCQGEGFVTVEMQFLADMYLECDTCGGKRYKQETLDATLNGKNIVEVLAMSVVIPDARQAARRSAMRSRGPQSAISSTSRSGTAAAASCLLPARKRSWMREAAWS